MVTHVIVIGGSAGSVRPLADIVTRLHPDLPAAVLVVVHIPAHHRGMLAEVLARGTRLRVAVAVDGEPLVPGAVLVAPPDHHLLVRGDAASAPIAVLDRGRRENRHRPAIDPLFRSAAACFGPSVTGVVLSGVLDDGAAGASAIRDVGGYLIAQDPAEAIYESMPASVIAQESADAVASSAEIPRILSWRAQGGQGRGSVHPRRTRGPIALRATEIQACAPATAPREVETVDLASERAEPVETELRSDDARGTRAEAPTERAEASRTCTRCGGTRAELGGEALVRYRGRVGPTVGGDAFAVAQLDAVEEAMWTAYRALAESAALAGRLAARARTNGRAAVARHFDDRRDAALQRADLIRRALDRG